MNDQQRKLTQQFSFGSETDSHHYAERQARDLPEYGEAHMASVSPEQNFDIASLCSSNLSRDPHIGDYGQ